MGSERELYLSSLAASVGLHLLDSFQVYVVYYSHVGCIRSQSHDMYCLSLKCFHAPLGIVRCASLHYRQSTPRQGNWQGCILYVVMGRRLNNTTSRRSHFTKPILGPAQTLLGQSPQSLPDIRACRARAHVHRQNMLNGRVRLSAVAAPHQSRHRRLPCLRLRGGGFLQRLVEAEGVTAPGIVSIAGKVVW